MRMTFTIRRVSRIKLRTCAIIRRSSHWAAGRNCFHNFAQLQAAAHDAATAIGKPRDYFTSTAYFRRQRRAMIMNFVYPYTPGIVWNMLGKVRGRRSPTA